MRAKLIFVNDSAQLEKIKETLRTRSHFVENPLFQTYFERILGLKNKTEPIFAIGIDEKQPTHIKLIYSLHVQYKLTRQLCKCVHIEELYNCPHVSTEKKEQFQKDLIPQLKCYKVVAINITENSTLKQNQKFMTIENKASL